MGAATTLRRSPAQLLMQIDFGRAQRGEFVRVWVEDEHAHRFVKNA
jgi:hypothetical protein